MLDEIAIQQTINRYSEGASRSDWERMLSTFTPSASWEIPAFGAVFRQHAVIREAMVGFIAQMAYFVQINSPAIISINGEQATARSITSRPEATSSSNHWLRSAMLRRRLRRPWTWWGYWYKAMKLWRERPGKCLSSRTKPMINPQRTC